jgi:hypothetical protein
MAAGADLEFYHGVLPHKSFHLQFSKKNVCQFGENRLQNSREMINCFIKKLHGIIFLILMQ